MTEEARKTNTDNHHVENIDVFILLTAIDDFDGIPNYYYYDMISALVILSNIFPL